MEMERELTSWCILLHLVAAPGRRSISTVATMHTKDVCRACAPRQCEEWYMNGKGAYPPSCKSVSSHGDVEWILEGT